jgi:hypothetical protein
LGEDVIAVNNLMAEIRTLNMVLLFSLVDNVRHDAKATTALYECRDYYLLVLKQQSTL